MSDRVFGGCGIVGIRVAGSERDVEPDVGTDFSNFVSVIPDRVAVFYFVLDTPPRQNANKICFCARLIRIFTKKEDGKVRTSSNNPRSKHTRRALVNSTMQGVGKQKVKFGSHSPCTIFIEDRIRFSNLCVQVRTIALPFHYL